MRKFLTGKVLWSYDYEVVQRSPKHHILAHFSGVLPFHAHKGVIYLTDKGLFIIGDADIQVPYNSFEQVYLGFDEIYPRTLVRNFGFFWRPLRIRFQDGFKPETIYLIINYNILGTSNQLWFNTLKEILSAS